MLIYIDGIEINAAEGMSVLDAATEAGIFIPHLCGHPDLEAKGGCRLCCVEIEGRAGAIPACMTAVEEAMQVHIHGEQAEKVRKTAMELILASHPSDCTGCPKYGKCELQSMYQYMGVSPEEWRKKAQKTPNDSSNPLIQHLFSRCVRCGRCIRACQELRGVKVLDYVKDRSGIHAGIPGGKSLKEAGCRFCGACIEICPTGSIMDAVGIMKDDRTYADSVVPCRVECPAHIDIPRFVRYIRNGEIERATAVIHEKVPFPKILGSVCTHPCESACKRNHLNEPVSVCKLKLAATINDSGIWKERRVCEPATGKKVAIIGAGPAGLTAAYYLVKQGHAVTVFEANEKAGGQCRYGIPAYRLPDDLLDSEISDILEIGVELKASTQIKTPVELLEQGYDAVLVAIGTHQGNRLPMEGNNLPSVDINTDFLKQVRCGERSSVAKRVMVLGGGNVAYDCARTAIRLGAKEVHITCLEAEGNMTSTPEEIKGGREEGIILHAGYSFLRIIGTDKVEGVEIQKIAGFHFDENRRAVMELVEDTKQVVAVDQVIFAVGQRPEGTAEMGLELVHGSYIAVDSHLTTSVFGIFAAGDVVTGTKSVIEAIAAGRRSAEEIDLYLGGNGDIDEELTAKEKGDPHIGSCPGFGDLPRTQPEIKSACERVCGFEAYEFPFDVEAAQYEASRCLQCDLRLDIQKVKLWNEY